MWKPCGRSTRASSCGSTRCGGAHAIAALGAKSRAARARCELWGDLCALCRLHPQNGILRSVSLRPSLVRASLCVCVKSGFSSLFNSAKKKVIRPAPAGRLCRQHMRCRRPSSALSCFVHRTVLRCGPSLSCRARSSPRPARLSTACSLLSSRGSPTRCAAALALDQIQRAALQRVST